MSSLDLFTEIYRKQYGSEIDDLIGALLSYGSKVAVVNPFLSKDDLKEITMFGHYEQLAGFSFWIFPKNITPRLICGLMSHYFLDRSSLLAPLFLPLSPGMKVLDMCSAPGGKLLVMLSRAISNISYIANDISSARVLRLRKVINSFVPHYKSVIKITNHDGPYFGLRNKGLFDAVLLDAPCSNEQHLLRNPDLLATFKGLRKNCSMRQYSLLCSALLTLKPHGHIMYATCSINDHENEGVIKKFLKRKGDQCELVQLNSPIGRSTEYGTTILPHLHNAGPAFFSLIRRK